MWRALRVLSLLVATGVAQAVAPRVIAMIPARIGSDRLPMKGLRMLGGQPVVQHAVEAAQSAGVFEEIVVNSDAQVFEEALTLEGSTSFYHRRPVLAGDTSLADDVVADFIDRYPGYDAVFWVNPTSPVQSAEDIRQSVHVMFGGRCTAAEEASGVPASLCASDAATAGQTGLVETTEVDAEGAEAPASEEFDTVITTFEYQRHGVLGGEPINFDTQAKAAKTQSLKPVGVAIYSILAWRCDTFMQAYKASGAGYFSGRVRFLPTSPAAAVILKYETDLWHAAGTLVMQQATEMGPLCGMDSRRWQSARAGAGAAAVVRALLATARAADLSPASSDQELASALEVALMDGGALGAKAVGAAALRGLLRGAPREEEGDHGETACAAALYAPAAWHHVHGRADELTARATGDDPRGLPKW